MNYCMPSAFKTLTVLRRKEKMLFQYVVVRLMHKCRQKDGAAPRIPLNKGFLGLGKGKVFTSSLSLDEIPEYSAILFAFFSNTFSM